ncbi:hypothetical protein [Streptomyces sp. NPDC002889]|uniref:hypothetical protein n=1 Tax=Streptomyces sp. NPDC002889 TaxID=3364669 RepID=UPI00368E01BC
MTPAKRKPPPSWLDFSSPMSDRPRTQLCPWCKAPILRALVGHVAAVQVRADPRPLDLQQELAARLQGRLTYCLRLHPLLRPRLLHRGPEHIRAGRCTHIVVADHQCTRTPAPAEPASTTEPDHLF